MITETLHMIFTSALISGIITGILLMLFKHQYDKRIEQYKNELETKKKAELVAQLLSEWISFPERKQELNRLTFEAFLWLPDDIAHKLSDLLSHKDDAPDLKDILLSVRQYLLDGKTNLNSENIIIFPQEHETKIV